MVDTSDAQLREALKAQARAHLWKAGDLTHLRDPAQRKIHHALATTTEQMFYLLCSRRLGKSYSLLLYAFEICIRKPGARILYLAPYARNADEIVFDIGAGLLADCPKDLRPEYKGQSKEYHWPNGSIIRIKGVNGEHAQYLRGGAADLVILDECALMDDLEHIVRDICMPMTMTTDGKIVFATTPPRSPGHESKKFYEECADVGAVSHFTIRDIDPKRMSAERKIKYLRAAGEKLDRAKQIILEGASPTTTTAKREYFCQFVTDADTAIIPEFDEEARKEICIEVPRPDYYDAYVGMDPGFNDKTGIIFGYWDWKLQKLVIEDEALLSRAGTPAIAQEIAKREHLLWGEKKPLLRVSDIDLRLIHDLYALHQLAFMKAEKPDNEASIALVRSMVQERRIIINPRCVGLIRQIQNAVWDKKGKDFAHDAVDAHYDLLASLKYLCRHVNKQRNPYPDWVNRPAFGTFHSPKSAPGKNYGLLSTTPFGRRVASRSKKTR